jgi:predicted nucleotidyltransferase
LPAGRFFWDCSRQIFQSARCFPLQRAFSSIVSGLKSGQAMTPSERKALDDYTAAVRAHYGKRLVDVLLFGSRARGDARPDSDADVAVVLSDGDWAFWDELMDLASLAYDVLLDHGLFIQPWPVSRSAWETPSSSPKRHFIETIRQDARSVLEPA